MKSGNAMMNAVIGPPQLVNAIIGNSIRKRIEVLIVDATNIPIVLTGPSMISNNPIDRSLPTIDQNVARNEVLMKTWVKYVQNRVGMGAGGMTKLLSRISVSVALNRISKKISIPIMSIVKSGNRLFGGKSSQYCFKSIES